MVARTSRLSYNTLGLPIATGRLPLISFRYNRGLSISDCLLRPRIGTHCVCVGVCPRAPKTPLLANLSSPLRLSMLRHNARAPAEAGGLIHWYFAVYTWVVTPHVKFIFYPEMKSERGNSQTSCLATVPCRVSFEKRYDHHPVCVSKRQ